MQILQQTLPKAWNKIIIETDDLLVDLISEIAEKISGIKAETGLVKQFLIKNRGQLVIQTGVIIPVSPILDIPVNPIARRKSPSTSVYIDRRLQSVGKTNFVLLCESILSDITEDNILMSLIPDTNKEATKRGIIANARSIIRDGHTREALTIIISSNLEPAIINKARHILGALEKPS
jgi:hypothetical protein